MKVNHTRQILAAALAALLVLGSLSLYGRTEASLLSPLELVAVRGTGGFWKNPCTIDGFMVGAGTVLGAYLNIGGIVTAYAGLMKAIYVDNCF